MSEGMKTCPKCGQAKPFSEYYKGKNIGGTSPYCKSCSKLYGQKWVHQNLEMREAAARERDQRLGLTEQTCKKCHKTKPIEEFAITNRERGWRRKECKACTKARTSAWAEKSKDNIREYQRQYHIDNREKIIAKAEAWAAEHPERRREITLSYYYRLQDDVIMHYGGYQCACPGCEVTEPLFLGIDHMNDDGAQHRKELGTLGGAKLYKDLQNRRYPPGYQVLCANCNQGRYRNKGLCPCLNKKH